MQQGMTHDEQEDWFRRFDAERKAAFMSSRQPGLGGVGDGGEGQQQPSLA
jgi:hypothetical protein